jgi:hypothetical protein
VPSFLHLFLPKKARINILGKNLPEERRDLVGKDKVFK